MARFQINTPILFAPPNPIKVWGYNATQTASLPTFGNFFNQFFGGSRFNIGAPNAGKMLEGMKRCYENNKTSNPVEAC